jgi:hypothetical protein
VRLERAGKLKKKSNNFIRNGTRDLPACSIVLQPIKLPRDPLWSLRLKNVQKFMCLGTTVTDRTYVLFEVLRV